MDKINNLSEIGNKYIKEYLIDCSENTYFNSYNDSSNNKLSFVKIYFYSRTKYIRSNIQNTFFNKNILIMIIKYMFMVLVSLLNV